MTVIPAIDIRDGKVVRLTQGDFKKETVYAERPAELYDAFVYAGAKRIHVVDLEGARIGEPQEFDAISEMAAKRKAQLQVGGGIRDASTIDRYLKAGVSRVICGTRACLDKGFLKEVASGFPEALIVGVDTADGKIATHGWTRVTDVTAERFIDELLEYGIREIVYTDIRKDGMMKGPNVDALKAILDKFEVNVIASGGVSTLADIKQLVALKNAHLSGAIVGKALYEGTLDLAEALKLC